MLKTGSIDLYADGYDHMQGVQRDANHAYVFNDDFINKYALDSNGEIITGAVLFNNDILNVENGLENCNYMDSPCLHDGYLYVVVRDTADNNPCFIVTFNAETLAYVSKVAIDTTKIKKGFAIDGDAGLAYLVNVEDDILWAYNFPTFSRSSGDDIALDFSDVEISSLGFTAPLTATTQCLSFHDGYFYFDTNKATGYTSYAFWRMDKNGLILYRLRYHSTSPNSHLPQGHDYNGETFWFCAFDSAYAQVWYMTDIVSLDNKDDWYVDNVNGSNSDLQGDGTAKAPFLTTTFANGTAVDYYGVQPGNNLILLDNGPTNPYREALDIGVAGTGSKRSVIESGSTVSYLTGADDATVGGPYTWIDTGVNGEWRSVFGVSVVDVGICSIQEWEGNGVLALNNISKSASSVGSLSPGEWTWNDVDSSVYYKPEGTLSDIHIEVSQRIALTISKDYSEAKNIQVRGGRLYSIQLKNADNCVLNTVESLLAYNTVGISVTGTSANNEIIGCTSLKNRYGVQAEATTGKLTISQSLIKGNFRSGARLEGNAKEAYGNVIIENGSSGYHSEGLNFVTAGATGLKAKNNIAWDNVGDDTASNSPVSPDFDYNNIESPGASWPSEPNGLSVDPQIDENGKLSGDSPCKNAGTHVTGITDDILVPPDIGIQTSSKTALIITEADYTPTGDQIKAGATLTLKGGGTVDLSGLTDTGKITGKLSGEIDGFTPNGAETKLKAVVQARLWPEGIGHGMGGFF